MLLFTGSVLGLSVSALASDDVDEEGNKPEGSRQAQEDESDDNDEHSTRRAEPTRPHNVIVSGVHVRSLTSIP